MPLVRTPKLQHCTGKRSNQYLFTLYFSSHSKFFHQNYWLQVLTNTRQGFSACHTYCYMGRLRRGPVTLTPVAGRLAVEQPLNLFLTTLVYRGQDLKTQPSTCEAMALTELPPQHYKYAFIQGKSFLLPHD